MRGNRRNTHGLLSPRMGFHYFPDTDHYTRKDLDTWLPVLNQLQAGWLVLLANGTRAIPEQFVTGLVNAGIKPIIHIQLPLPNSPAGEELKTLFSAYARWGVKHIMLFDKPNRMQSWSSSGWVQQDLVERFIDRFLPLALAVAQAGMIPIFPPLEPVGSYWDLSFLKQSLQSMQRRGYHALIDHLGIASYAYTFNHDLDYGAGGPGKWPNALPYGKPADSQDQQGFRNYEWLQSAAISAIGKELPLFMLGAGVKEPGSAYSPELHAGVCLNIIELLKKDSLDNRIPDTVQSCNFYLLSADPSASDHAHAWYKADGGVLPIVNLLSNPGLLNYTQPGDLGSTNDEFGILNKSIASHPIAHYLLLPLYDWGVADYHLEVTRPFVQKHHPTIGFSIQEASLAIKVTVIGGEQTFPEEMLSQLRASGSIVERITGDGTSIATQLAER